MTTTTSREFNRDVSKAKRETMTVVTRNVSDFSPTRVRTLNPWRETSFDS